MQAASTQRVSSNSGRDNEHVLAEFAYQPAAEGKGQGGQAKSAGKAEVMQLVHVKTTTPKHPVMPFPAAQHSHLWLVSH